MKKLTLYSNIQTVYFQKKQKSYDTLEPDLVVVVKKKKKILRIYILLFSKINYDKGFQNSVVSKATQLFSRLL